MNMSMNGNTFQPKTSDFIGGAEMEIQGEKSEFLGGYSKSKSSL